MSNSDYQGFIPEMPTSASFTITLERMIAYTGGVITIGEDGISRIENDHTGMQYFTLTEPSHIPIIKGKIIDRFWKREIGFESMELFEQAMRTKLNEIMPYFDALYESQKIEFDPLSTINIRNHSTGNVTGEQSNQGEATQEASAKNISRSVASNTPQTILSGNKDYASSASDTNGDTTSDTTSREEGSSTNTVDNVNESLTTGYTGIASDLLMRYRAAILNVDVMILDALEELFMSVWDTGDEYYPRPMSTYTYSTIGYWY